MTSSNVRISQSRRVQRFGLGSIVTVALLACGQSESPLSTPTDRGRPTQGEVESSTDNQPVAAPQSEANSASTPEAAPAASACSALNLDAVVFRDGDPGSEGVELGDTAGDFTTNTTEGPWSLAEEWSGCDSYVFVSDPGNSTSVPTLSTEFFTRSALNTHYFFLSATNPVQGASAWKTQVSAELAQLPEAERGHWQSRVHFVTDSPPEVAGSVGNFSRAHPGATGFAIDRAQTWDNLGSATDFIAAGPVTDVDIFGYSSRYYNFRFDQAARLATEHGITEVPLMANTVFAPETNGPNGPFSNSNQASIWPAEFPNSATMASFDTMVLLLEGECGPDPENDCGRWDYEAFIQLCADENCEAVVGEVARWITPYSRPGKRSWVLDISQLLGLVRAGGTQYFRFRMVWNMNPNTWNMTFRLRDAAPTSPIPQTEPAWSGNRALNAEYSSHFPPIDFTPPEGTEKVELFAVISGHGQDTDGCSEWCEHQHEITVNGGTPHLHEFPNHVRAKRCAELVDEGVVPGQFGNWTPGRAGWCPGMPVQPWVLDITEEVTIGEPNTIDYRALIQNEPIAEDGLDRGRIRLQTYLVYSR